jgi:hypothetical protein
MNPKELDRDLLHPTSENATINWNRCARNE